MEPSLPRLFISQAPAIFSFPDFVGGLNVARSFWLDTANHTLLRREKILFFPQQKLRPLGPFHCLFIPFLRSSSAQPNNDDNTHAKSPARSLCHPRAIAKLAAVGLGRREENVGLASCYPFPRLLLVVQERFVLGRAGYQKSISHRRFACVLLGIPSTYWGRLCYLLATRRHSLFAIQTTQAFTRASFQAFPRSL